MALEPDPEWPGASDNDEKADPYINSTEVRRIARELNELLKTIKDFSGEVVMHHPQEEGGPAFHPEPVEGGGSWADLQRYCALSLHQMGSWNAAMQYGFAVQSAFRELVGETAPGLPGSYAHLVSSAEEVFDEGLLEIARTSERAESASEEAATQRHV